MKSANPGSTMPSFVNLDKLLISYIIIAECRTHHYPYFKDKETEAKRLGNFFRATQFISSGIRDSSQGIH